MNAEIIERGLDMLQDFLDSSEDQADALNRISGALKSLGNNDAATEFGAIENLAMEVRRGAELIEDGLRRIAEALEGS